MEVDTALENVELTLLRVDCFLRRQQMAELAISASEYSGLRSQYRETVYVAVLSYLVQSETGSRAFKNEIKQAIVAAFPDSFYAGYSVNGEQEVETDDDAWLTAKIGADVALVDLMFSNLKALKDQVVPPSEYAAEAQRRADGYSQTLDSVFAEGRLRGAKSIMLTLGGDDGEESCSTCQRLKGKRHRAKWWAENGLIPGQPGNANYECRGYQCQHRLFTDTGEVWTF